MHIKGGSLFFLTRECAKLNERVIADGDKYANFYYFLSSFRLSPVNFSW